MYVPPYFRVDEPELIRSFIQQNSFGTLVSCDGQSPIATHLPFLVNESREALELAGHIARANPQGKSLGDDREILAMFQGPHTYVTPRWYAVGGVPTWNYQAVHCYGRPVAIDDAEELYNLLHELVARNEGSGVAGAPFALEELERGSVDSMMGSIIGFRIRVSRVEASFKLSQNKKPEELRRIVAGLRTRTDEGSKRIAAAMEEHYGNTT